MQFKNFINAIPRKVRLAAVMVWAAFIAFITHLPNPPSASLVEFDYADKIAHFAMYFALALLFYSAVTNKSSGLGVILIVFLCCAAYGAMDEYTQRYAAGRNPDFYDWLADAAGSLSALAAVGLTRLTTRPS